MEQTSQQISQKPPFPIKTKIAAWWMIIIGFFLMVGSWHAIVPEGKIEITMDSWVPVVLMFAIFYIVLLFFFLILPAIFLLKRKKLAWGSSIVLISIMVISLWLYVGGYSFQLYLRGDSSGLFLFSIITIITIIPLILLFLDRKNFFKIAS